MAPAKESHTCKQFTAGNSLYLDHMAHPHLDKNISVPCFPPYNAAAYPGQHASDLPSVYTGQQDAVGGFCEPVSPFCNVSYPTGNLYLRDSQRALSRASLAPQRRFLIFDRSENQTRLFISPPRGQILASKTPASGIGSFEEKWDENDLWDGEGEDSDEINALLYSDSDDDDEVSSTGHSPPSGLQEGLDRDKSVDEARKRQRFGDGKYKRSSLERGMDGYEDDVESRCGGGGSKKAKIREALRMLESIIPGLEDKDPVSIIDGAVAYLKSMKTEAQSLHSERESEC